MHAILSVWLSLCLGASTRALRKELRALASTARPRGSRCTAQPSSPAACGAWQRGPWQTPGFEAAAGEPRDPGRAHGTRVRAGRMLTGKRWLKVSVKDLSSLNFRCSLSRM